MYNFGWIPPTLPEWSLTTVYEKSFEGKKFAFFVVLWWPRNFHHEIFVWHKISLVVPCKREHFYTYCFQFTQPQNFSPSKLFSYTVVHRWIDDDRRQRISLFFLKSCTHGRVEQFWFFLSSQKKTKNNHQFFPQAALGLSSSKSFLFPFYYLFASPPLCHLRWLYQVFVLTIYN